MRDWVNQNYPGTRLAVTEYNWGAFEHINGALAQADVLGIFGRGGIDLATLWGVPEYDDPAAFAFRMYRNYDGQGSAFGNQSLSCSSADQEKLSVYAAVRDSDGALTLMIINKSGKQLNSTVSLSNFVPSGSAEVYQYSESDLSTITRKADIVVTASGFEGSFPKNAITLFVLLSRKTLSEAEG